MISKDEALAILHGAIPSPTESEDLPLEDVAGRVLAEDLASDLDVPPFNRSAMDGFAVQSRDLGADPVELEVVDVIKAGEVSSATLGSGQCAKIMTGAPVPAGADAVVMVEQSETAGDSRVRIMSAVRPGENIAPRGQDLRDGEVVLAKGTPIRAIEVGMMATIGRDRVRVFRQPKVAVAATGDELIPPGQGRPGPGQIRESNGHMLTAQVRSLGPSIRCQHLGITKDSPEDVRRTLDRGLASDVLILSGGVSMGDWDFVHHELHALGLEVLIEKIAIKPGKPLLFGRLTAENGRPLWVFGLPGNPVSSYVTFELFARPFLRGLTGRPGPHFLELDATIQGGASGKAIPRTQHLPARIAAGRAGLEARPVSWHGSGDLRGLVDANGFIIVPAGESLPAEGEVARVLLTEPDVLRLPPFPSRTDS